MKDGPSLLISLHQVDLLPDLWSVDLSLGCGRYLGFISYARDVGFCLVGCCGSCSSESLFFACLELWVFSPWVLAFVMPRLRTFDNCLLGDFCSG